MTIGQLAKATETEPQTIRYYERIGLLESPKRTVSNYRVYGEGSVRKLSFIRRAKQIGLTLSDIKTLIAMSEGRIGSCDEIRDFIEIRLARVKEQIVNLKAIEGTLEDLARQCRDRGTLSSCPILESLTDDVSTGGA